MDTPRTDSVFDALTPDLILNAVEKHLGIFLDGGITPYNSYINRVFGVTDDNENAYIVKFYRPGRWSEDAIGDEHDFLFDCAELDIPVVPPLTGTAGYSVGSEEGYLFAVFPRCRARTFDITSEEGWIRTGSVIGRMHRAGKKREARDRLRCNPQETTERYISSLTEKGLVHPDCLEDFSSICAEALRLIDPLFNGIQTHRIHGDCHRGNILENSGGIILIDFDDMMNGPAVQDLWLLLSGHLSDSMQEMNLMIEGYEQFCEFDRSSLALVEPLRFMRHIYFLNWCATQHGDTGFDVRFPDWGTKAFWIKETEDLSGQLEYIQNGLYT
jgi:Ser/Thr protein kinase RdoA (MazF antagonist)